MDFNLNSVFQALVPKDKKFFPLFEQASANMVRCAEKLHEALRADSVKRLAMHREIENLERQGDEITHVIMKESATNFITPFDREDIQYMAVTIDDVADYIHGISKRIELYKIHQFHPSMLEISSLILEACQNLDIIVRSMRELRFTPQIRQALQRMRECEKHVDELHDDAIAKLFSSDVNAVEVLKLKEVLSFMSSCTDKCEESGSIIESVLIKFS